MKARITRLPDCAILCSTLLWGTLWIPLRQLRETSSSGALATAAGFLLPPLALLPFALPRWRRLRAGGRAPTTAGFYLALAIALYAEGLVRGQVARVLLLFYLTPIWSTLLARWLLGQEITGRRVVAIVLGLAGMVVIFGLEAGVPSPGAAAEWMGLAAGLVWGVAMVYVKRSESRPLLDRVFVPFVFLGPVFFLVSLIPGGEGAVGLEPRAFLDAGSWLLAFALIWMLPVVWLTIFGAGRLEPGRVAIFLMFEIVVGLSTATLLTDEPFGRREFVGALLIMGASGVEIGAAPPAAQLAA